MKTEVEVKFLNIDFDQLRPKLLALGAVCEQPMRLMRRVIIEPPHLTERNAFIRVRDEGDKVTLTYKQFDDHSAFSGAKEIELIVSDFAAMTEVLTLAGLSPKSTQESRRETWRLGDVEVVLDEWPWLNPYIEIEGPTEASVQEAARLLGFSWNDAVFGSVTAAYQLQYPKGQASKLSDMPEVLFDAKIPAVISGEKEVTI